jgi:anti-anti-sigma factor
MYASAQEFQVDSQGDVLIVTPTGDLNELDFARIEEEATAICDRLRVGPARNIVVDFEQSDYYGSTALGVFVKLWKQVVSLGGKLAFCNLSSHEQRILDVSGLGGLWPVCHARREALAAVRC